MCACAQSPVYSPSSHPTGLGYPLHTALKPDGRCPNQTVTSLEPRPDCFPRKKRGEGKLETICLLIIIFNDEDRQKNLRGKPVVTATLSHHRHFLLKISSQSPPLPRFCRVGLVKFMWDD